MTVHFRKHCNIVKNVICHVPCETKWNKDQPHLTMIGWASEVKVYDEQAHILP